MTIDYTGQKYGMLTVVRPTPKRRVNRSIMWECICDCGETVERDPNSIAYNITQGMIPNCGCLKRLPEGEASRNNCLRAYKKDAKKRGLEWELTKDEAFVLFSGNCHYCDAQSTNNSKGVNGDYKYNGIDRLNSNVGYNILNCVSCCKHCNRIKGTMDLDELRQYIVNVYNHSLSGNFSTKEASSNGEI